MEIGASPIEIAAVPKSIFARQWELERRRCQGESAMEIGASPIGISVRRWRWRGGNGESRDADEHFRPAMGIGDPAMSISGAAMA